jgi:glycosyltransferase involved in cell wall biosynthesis
MDTLTKPIPLLWVSDSVSCTSGLGRISRDICTRIHHNMPDVFRVASLGYGGPGKREIPFQQYHAHSVQDWMLPELPLVWDDFASDEPGIVMINWDASRVGWFADPRLCPIPHLRKWLETAKIRKWTYTPIDAEGPNGKLSWKLKETLKGFERVLNYSKFSADVTGYPDFLPHGIDTSIFKPYDKVKCKQEFRKMGFMGLKDNSFLVGIVATNQARKDWALGIQTCRLLLDRGLDVRLWAHTDTVERYWDLAGLITDYQLQGRVVITVSNYDDEQMAKLYSACDVTLGIGLGEGFGYPIFESLACGTPCIHGDYGGAADWMPDWMKVSPVNFRGEGIYCNRRPVYDVPDWANATQRAAAYVSANKLTPDGSLLSGALDWIDGENDLWGSWEEWLRAGVK